MDFIALSSSRGTTFEAILQRIADGSLKATCHALVTDKADRGCVEKAKAYGVPVRVVEKVRGEPREKYDERLHDVILSISPTVREKIRTHSMFIAAVGWMWLLSPSFVRRWRDRIINVHPSLLPKYPGAHAHAEVLASGDTVSGMTIHLIDEGVDTGTILLQKECPVLPGDTEDTLKLRVQELEKQWYPEVLQMIADQT